MSEPHVKSVRAVQQAFEWFDTQHWMLRYLMICGVLCVPAPLLAWYAGTLTEAQNPGIEVPLIRDYVFLYSWLFAVPYALLMLPRCFRSMDEVLDELVESLLLSSKEKSIGVRKCIIWGFCISALLVFGIAAANIRSMLKPDGIGLYWWFPSGRGWLACVYFLTICLFASSLGIASFVRYMTTMKRIKQAVEEVTHIPTWIGTPDGPVDRLFRSVFMLFLPAGGIPLLIVRNRLFLRTEWDPVFCFNLFIAPIILAIMLMHPIYYSGLLVKFRRQRSGLLRACDKTMAAHIKELSRCIDPDRRKELCEQLEFCSNEKELIARNHPYWPIGFLTKLLPMIPLTLSLIPPLTVAIGLVKRLLFRE